MYVHVRWLVLLGLAALAVILALALPQLAAPLALGVAVAGLVLLAWPRR